jgi:hypothetical protein
VASAASQPGLASQSSAVLLLLQAPACGLGESGCVADEDKFKWVSEIVVAVLDVDMLLAVIVAVAVAVIG